MRLLDQITQHARPLLVSQRENGVAAARILRLPGAADYAAQIAACPLRYVLNDDLTSVCTELALAGGDRLSSCLDLIHLPAAALWIEWNDAARERVLNGGSHVGGGTGGGDMGRAGALIHADADGRRALLRTFWLDIEGIACLAPMETHLDLSCAWPAGGSLQSVFAGGFARLTVSHDPGLEALLECMRFRFHPQWAAYYRDAGLGWPAQEQLLRASLATVARDMPVVLAFSLLLGAHNALATRRVDRQRLNQRRRERHKPPLLDHLEVSCRLEGPAASQRDPQAGAPRRSPRLHHVRGHLVRRDDELYWRRTHLRGRASLGRVRSRTVRLSFGGAPGTHATRTALP
jgi:hypothetical protein